MLMLKQFLLCIYIFTTSIVSTDCTNFCDFLDPCTDSITNLPSPERRTDNCDYTQDQKCDDLISSTWYKTEALMLDHCPQKSSCGALYPIWLDGQEPSVSEGAVVRTACLVGSSCCDRTYSIKIKNCTSFQAYCLPSTTGCPERYCFGQNGTCRDPTTTSTTTSTPTSTTASLTQSAGQNTQPPKNHKEYYINHVHCVAPVTTVLIAIVSMVVGGIVVLGVWRISLRRKVTDDDGLKKNKDERKEKIKMTDACVSKRIEVAQFEDPPPKYKE